MLNFVKSLFGIKQTLRTDLNIVQLPNPLPNFGGFLGRNIIQKDPDFGTKIVRITDGSDNKGMSMQTGDSGQDGIWNTDDTLIALRSTGGARFLYQFNPSKFQISFLGIKYKGDICFSQVFANILYEQNNGIVYKHKLVKVNGVWTDPNPATIVCDFTKILPSGFKIKWSSTFNVSEYDKQIVVGFSDGVQNTGIYCCVYRAAAGLRMLNTSTAVVSGDWGEIGTVRLKSANTSFPFTMHECNQFPNPLYVHVGPKQDGNTTPLVWEVDTLDILDSNTSGHGADGYLAKYTGGPGGGQLKVVPYDGSTPYPLLPADVLPASQGQKYDGDSHFGFGKIVTDDQSVIWATGQTSIYPFTSAWMNEVRGYDVTKKVVYRACHTFNSGKSPEFITACAIAIPSQTGKFVAFSSDMMGSLGNDPQKGTIRGDTFIVKVV